VLRFVNPQVAAFVTVGVMEIADKTLSLLLAGVVALLFYEIFKKSSPGQKE
jgi:hypothetical protein